MKAHSLNTEPNATGRSTHSPYIKKKNIEAIYPLSPMQEGLLFHNALEPSSGAYVEQLECTLRGRLDIKAFGRAWQHVVDRHGVLRTGFFSKALQKPLQIVSRQVPVGLDVRDWRELSPEEQQQNW